MAFHRHPHADTRVRSAIAVIRALLPLDLYPPLRRRFLSNCLWQITQAEGRTKYDLRFRSRAALAAPPKEWRHEHVFRRKRMVDALLAQPNDVERIVANAVGCLVTKEEHDQLARIDRQFPDLDGWERYRRAGIVVVDMATEEEHG